jgi:hypothetical protein
MSNDNLDLFLAMWGALLSTVLAVMKIAQDRKASAVNLFIDCRDVKNDDGDVLWFFISNSWTRPVTLVEISWGIGSDREFQQLIYTWPLEKKLKLEISEPFEATIRRAELVKAAGSLSDEAFLFMRLWIHVKLSSGRKISRPVEIGPVRRSVPTTPRYDAYLATSAFFDRDLLMRYTDAWARKMKYEKR